MIQMQFRRWLESDETYERRFAPRALKAAARLGGHPFAGWFPPGRERAYLPLKTPAVSAAAHFFQTREPRLSAEDREVLAGLRGLGFEVADYRLGYVRRGQGQEKIGGVLKRLSQLAQDAAEKQRYERWYGIFVNSPARQTKKPAQNLFVVISRNPHDIARMSYDRSWSSCMELEDGQYKNVPFCVIRSGGMVAYLVSLPEERVRALAADASLDIPDPLARVSIKAAYNTRNRAQVLAVPETRVYPRNVKGFWETVFDWLEERQGHIMGSGKYKVLGGYSDDYGAEATRSHLRPPRNPEGLYRWLGSPYPARREAATELVLNSRRDFPPEVYERVKDLLMSQASNSWFHASDSRENEQLSHLYERLPDLFKPEERQRLPYLVKSRTDLLGEEDRVADAFAARHEKPDSVWVPSPHETGAVVGVLERVGRREARFQDSYSINRLTEYVRRVTRDLASAQWHPQRPRQELRDRAPELRGQAHVLARALLRLLAQKNWTGLAHHVRWDLANGVSDLASSTLAYLPLGDLFDDLVRVIEELLDWSPDSRQRAGIDLRYQGLSEARQRYADDPEMLRRLDELGRYLESTPAWYKGDAYQPHPWKGG